MNKLESEYIIDKLSLRDDELVSASDDIEYKKNMNEHYRKLNLKIHGKRFFQNDAYSKSISRERALIAGIILKLKGSKPPVNNNKKG